MGTKWILQTAAALAVIQLLTGCDTCIPCEPSSSVDHASWMHDQLGQLGGRQFSQLILPASHDAGMYKAPFLGIGKTQCLSIYEQLRYGIRWFDLRPKSSGTHFIIHHGMVPGPDFGEVLADVRRFASEQKGELIILKLSHFDGIDCEKYTTLANQIDQALGPWLVKDIPAPLVLAEMTLSQYVAQKTAVLVLVDGEYAVKPRRPGFWVYRDWDSDTPQQADLCVFDQYANTVRYHEMVQDQSGKFDKFDGHSKVQNMDCPMFLLSWTLTPTLTSVWSVSKPANKNLDAELEQWPITNRNGKIINLIYVDFAEAAHVTEVAIKQNKRYTPPVPIAHGSYDVQGHYYAVEWAATIADTKTKYQIEPQHLAFYAELPDRLVETTAWDFRLDILGEVMANLFTFGYACPHFNDIQRYLHSLDGGSALDRRKCIEARLRVELKNSPQIWKAGFLIHAYGDAYAHSYLDERPWVLSSGAPREKIWILNPELGKPILYEAPLGHGLKGETPDQVRSNFELFGSYFLHLTEILNGGPLNADQRGKAEARLAEVKRDLAGSDADESNVFRHIFNADDPYDPGYGPQSGVFTRERMSSDPKLGPGYPITLPSDDDVANLLKSLKDTCATP